MRDYVLETEKRVAFIRELVRDAGAKGIVFGNSGGKDCALVGILCKMACENTLGIILPCSSKRNFGIDKTDAEKIAAQFKIETRLVNLTSVKEALAAQLSDSTVLTDAALANIAPRLRMTSLYAVAASEGRLVAGTGNRSERYTGYFTKWGDGAFDFNPIADLTVTEVYEFLRHLGAPDFLFEKAPSAGLFDGQTDEAEMGISYGALDGFLMNGTASAAETAIIERLHKSSEHKRRSPAVYSEE